MPELGLSSIVVIGIIVLFILLLLLILSGSRMRLPLVVGALLLLVLLAFTSCQGSAAPRLPGSGKGSIDFAEIFEKRGSDAEELRVVKTETLDVDGDTEEEWVVLYQYDPTLERNWDNAPVKAAIYDALPCTPPEIYSWELATPDNDYMGEGPNITAYLSNLLPSPKYDAVNEKFDAVNELVIKGSSANSQTLSLWRYHDESSRFPCDPVNPQQQYFGLLGFWRADVITLDVIEPENEGAGDPTAIVTTYRRTAFERSQLAIRSIYKPTTDSGPTTFIGPNGRTLPPVEQGVAFIYGTPALPTDSPYPEKAVATMLLGIGQAEDAFMQRFFNGTTLEAPELWKSALARALGVNSWDDLEGVIIQSIAYQPDRNAELRHEPRAVRTTVVPVSKVWGRMPPREITWSVLGFTVENPKDCEWRIAGIPGYDVTPGTGYRWLDGQLALTHD
ncbi:MAG: hypothetical protein H6638_03345 [Ardenticatenales bacterium]|nr:hypothetical protein [Ardenticatenales bacterium]